MGSWGVRAHESDEGLNLFAVVENRYLRGVKFKTFHIRHITELLRSNIIDKFVKESSGWESEYIDYFYEYTLPYRFAHAVMLVAECFAEYRQKGEFLVDDYEAKKERRITEFIYSNKDLEALRTELQAILEPRHSLYDSWKDSDSFDEWQTHMQMLCDALSQAISEGGEEHE